MGRPRKSELRDRQLNLSLTEREFENIKERAQAVGMRPVHFGRFLVLDNSGRPAIAPQPADSNAQKLIYAQLSRLGNLLNQMVRHLHQTGDPLPPDLEPLLRDIRQILTRRDRDDR